VFRHGFTARFRLRSSSYDGTSRSRRKERRGYFSYFFSVRGPARRDDHSILKISRLASEKKQTQALQAIVIAFCFLTTRHSQFHIFRRIVHMRKSEIFLRPSDFQHQCLAPCPMPVISCHNFSTSQLPGLSRTSHHESSIP